jgi:predicted transcriptional regulator
MATPLGELVDETGLRRSAIAHRLGITPSALSNKLLGKRLFTLGEAQGLVRILTRHLGRRVRVEDVEWETLETAEPSSVDDAVAIGDRER